MVEISISLTQNSNILDVICFETVLTLYDGCSLKHATR